MGLPGPRIVFVEYLISGLGIAVPALERRFRVSRQGIGSSGTLVGLRVVDSEGDRGANPCDGVFLSGS